MSAVEAIIRDVTDAEIRPRFRALAAADIRLKGPGDYVTEADVGAERALSARLRAVADVPVIGEEATADDPDLLTVVDTAEASWVIDPIDGTANFVAGREGYAVMVAFVERGVPAAGWIYQPELDVMVSAIRGQGAYRNGERLATPAVSSPPVGWFSTPHAPEHLQPALRDLAQDLSPMAPPGQCSGFDYINLATGAIDFVMHFNTKPWDHAPGASIVRELGMRVARLDGSDYTTADVGSSILVAPRATWENVSAHASARLELSEQPRLARGGTGDNG